MEDAELHFHRTGPRCWWQQPLPHSRFLSAGCEGKKTRTYPSFSSFYLHRIKIHLLTTAGARESLSSYVSEHGCASKFPAYFLLPASRWRCSAYKQLTASTILWSHDLGHYQIRAITCYNSSLPQQLPQAVQLNGAIGGCVCVSLLFAVWEDKLCSEAASVLLLPVWTVGWLLMPDSRFVSPAVQLQRFISPQGKEKSHNQKWEQLHVLIIFTCCDTC